MLRIRRFLYRSVYADQHSAIRFQNLSMQTSTRIQRNLINSRRESKLRLHQQRNDYQFYT